MQRLAKRSLDRRQFIAGSAAIGAGVTGLSRVEFMEAAEPTPKKRVAAIATIYRHNSHADVLLTKILRGWKHDDGPGPALELVSLYVDQFPAEDMSRDLAERYGFPICSSISQALTLGQSELAVDGVLSIGEHGDYPWNDMGQHLYPRRRFFEEITATMASCKTVVPVFNDKHPGPQWDDAQWMYQRAKELGIPWMAGSSLPVSFRDPDVTLDWQADVRSCVGIGYSGLDIYGIHTLEFLQCLLERRATAAQGLRHVQCLPTTSVPRLLEDGTLEAELLAAGLQAAGTQLDAVLQSPPADGAVFLLKYQDGLLAPVLMLSGLARGIAAALRVADGTILATRVEERPEPRYPHFAYLLKGIEAMFHSGRPAYPVERSLLMAGALDRLLRSRSRQHQPIDTPELGFNYHPVDYGYAPHLPL